MNQNECEFCKKSVDLDAESYRTPHDPEDGRVWHLECYDQLATWHGQEIYDDAKVVHPQEA